jgi:hypothetical protein
MTGGWPEGARAAGRGAKEFGPVSLNWRAQEFQAGWPVAEESPGSTRPQLKNPPSTEVKRSLEIYREAKECSQAPHGETIFHSPSS